MFFRSNMFQRICTILFVIPSTVYFLKDNTYSIYFLCICNFLTQYEYQKNFVSKVKKKISEKVGTFYSTDKLDNVIILTGLFQNILLYNYSLSFTNALTLYMIIFYHMIHIFNSTIEKNNTILNISTLGLNLVGHFFINIAFNYLTAIRMSENGYGNILLLLSICWIADTGGLLIGKKFGSLTMKCCKSISKGKTLAGFIGVILFGVIISFATYYVLSYLSLLPIISDQKLLQLGIIISFTSLFGDLFESILKRSVGIKDSSNVLPGHGGIIDLIDSILFSAPIYYYLL